MNDRFRRQLVDYVEYHRDPRNCGMHVVGITTLFLGAVIPLTRIPVHVLGIDSNLAVILALPAVLYWLWLDFALGLGTLVAAIGLLTAATFITANVSTVTMWVIVAVLIPVGVASQLIGHQVFEGRKPSLVDNPSHLMLGPVFVMAKLYNFFGYRRDLALIIEAPSLQPAIPGERRYSQ